MMKIIFNALMVLRGWFNTLACCQLLDSGFNQWLWWRWSRSKCCEDDSAFWLVVDYDSDRELLCQRGHRCGQSNSINWLLMSRGGWEWRWLITVIITNDNYDECMILALNLVQEGRNRDLWNFLEVWLRFWR